MPLKGKPVGPMHQNIFRAPDRTYFVNFVAKTPTSQRARFTKTGFVSLKAAREWRDAEKVRIRQMNENVETGNLTFGYIVEILREEAKNHNTEKNILQYLQRLEDFFGAATPLVDIDQRRVNAYQTHLNNERKRPHGKDRKDRGAGQLAAGTKNRILAKLRQVFNRAREYGYVGPIPKIKLHHEGLKRDLPITTKQFLAVVQELPSAPNVHRALFLMAYFTGQRWADCSSMKWDQLATEQVEVDGESKEMMTVVYKSSKTQIDFIKAAIPDVLRSELDGLPKTCDCIFANPETQEPLTSIKNPLATAIKRAKVPRFTFHHIRHLFTTDFLAKTKDKDLTRRLAGWSKDAMVDRYGHVSNRAIDASISLGENVDQILNNGNDCTPESTPEKRDKNKTEDKVND